MLNRRSMILGGPVLVASTVVWTTGADASIGGIFKRVASTVVQGVNFVTNPAQQIATATRVLAPLIRQASPEASRAVEVINKIAEQNSTLEGRLRIISAVGMAQGLPIFANTGFTDEQVPTHADQSAQPLQLTSSVEDELRADPFGYVQKNADYLADHAKTFPFTRVPAIFSVGAGSTMLERTPPITPTRSGYFSSVLTIADIIRLVSIFRG